MKKIARKCCRKTSKEERKCLRFRFLEKWVCGEFSHIFLSFMIFRKKIGFVHIICGKIYFKNFLKGVEQTFKEV